MKRASGPYRSVPRRAAILAVALALALPGLARAQDETEEGLYTDPPRPSTSTLGQSLTEQDAERERREEIRRRLASAATLGPLLPGAVDPDTYRVGPGDVFMLAIWGGVTRNVPIEVSPEGAVLLPNSGTMRIAGMTLRQARNDMLARLRPEFRGVQMDLRLQRPRQFLVYVTGQVSLPGPMTAHGASRVSDLLLGAEPMTGASLRNIEVIHRDGTREPADLELFLRTASQELNPWLRDGDVIHVPSASRFISIQGAVARPARMELGPRDSLRTLIALGGGLIPSADTTRALLIRWLDASRSESTTVNVSQVLAGRFNPPLRGGDHFYVYYIPRFQMTHSASVLGEVLRPGIYPIQVGRDRVSDVIRAAGGFLPDADLAAIRVRRQSDAAAAEDPELQRLLRLPRRDLTNSEYDVLQTKLAALRIEYRIDWSRLQSDAALDVLLLGGDVVQVDRLVSSIRVDGQVRRPGILAFTPGRSPLDYVELAGGYSERAWRSKIRVTRSVTGQTFYAKDVPRLDPGDLIWVPERPDVTFWDQARTVLTAAAEIATVILAFNAVSD